MARAEDYRDGRWDAALVRIETFLAQSAAAGGNYLDSGMILQRATIAAARGDAASAERDVAAALAKTDMTGDVQNIVPSLLEAAFVKVLLGDLKSASDYLDTALPHIGASRMRAPAISADNCVTIVRCGRAAEWLELSQRFAETGRVWAARLVYRGRTVDAAELYGWIGHPEEEAVVRLLAAEQLAEAGRPDEADVQLQRALAFYRAVGATAIVRQVETLLAAAS
jgi:tetratricopeptide (TPR) repeat protein